MGGGGGGGLSLLYIYIAYNMQKGGGWVQIACKNAYVLKGRPLECMLDNELSTPHEYTVGFRTVEQRNIHVRKVIL